MKIQILKADKLIKEYDIVKDAFVLGRAEDCDIVVLEEGVSRKHVEFKKIDDKSVSFSKKSKFGILAKDGKTAEEGVLSINESLEIGDVRLTLVEDTKVDIMESNSEKVPEPPKKSKKLDDFELFTMAEASGVEEDKKEKEEQKEKQKPKATIPEKDSSIQTEGEFPKTEVSSVQQNLKEGTAPRIDAADATMVGPAFLLYQLIAISGPYKDKTFSLDRDTLIVGRSNMANIILIDDLVSREHARLNKQGVDYYLVDLNSGNGTKLNGKKISEPSLLMSGDIVEIGASTLRFMVINPQVQGATGLDLGMEEVHKQPSVEKVAPRLSDREIKSIEKSFGYEPPTGAKKKKPFLLIFMVLVVVAVAVMFLMPKKEPPKPPKAETPPVEAPKEEVPEVQCSETGSFCQLAPGMQKQLLAEYDVAVKLFKNFQYELAEDRAQQILSSVPDWQKAKDLLDLAGAEKEKLIAQKKQEEENEIKKMLEEKLSKLVHEAQGYMRNEKFDKVKDLVSKILEIDPNNQDAKKMIDRIEEIYAERKKVAEKKAEFLAALSKYKNVFSDGKRFYDKKEYMKAIEIFQRCLNLPSLDSADAKGIKEQCRTLLDDSNRLLREAITPELTVAEELFTTGQFREAIASYQRVLKIDYKNKTAKLRIIEARKSIDEEARDNYARAAIAESVSDFKSACLLYYKVLQIAMPGTKYYTDSLSKTKRLCSKNKDQTVY